MTKEGGGLVLEGRWRLRSRQRDRATNMTFGRARGEDGQEASVNNAGRKTVKMKGW